MVMQRTFAFALASTSLDAAAIYLQHPIVNKRLLYITLVELPQPREEVLAGARTGHAILQRDCFTQITPV